MVPSLMYLQGSTEGRPGDPRGRRAYSTARDLPHRRSLLPCPDPGHSAWPAAAPEGWMVQAAHVLGYVIQQL